jgi:hypothetical protein
LREDKNHREMTRERPIAMEQAGSSMTRRRGALLPLALQLLNML